MTVNHVVFERDAGLGDDWYTPLPNGYRLEAIDVTDHGTVYDPKVSKPEGSSMVGPNTVYDVRLLQVDGNIIAGTFSEVFEPGEASSPHAEHYFLIDVGKSSKVEPASMAALNDELARRGLKNHLDTFWNVLSSYHNTWFDYLAVVFLLLVPASGLFLLTAYVVKIRRHRLPVAV
jgi:hypothetical protein